MKTFHSDLSGKIFPDTEKVSAKTIRHSILELIQKDFPNFNHDSFLSMEELNLYRDKYITAILTDESGELKEAEKTVLNSFSTNSTLTDKLIAEDDSTTTFGQKLADKVAIFGGSWKFIILFGIVIVIWMSINIFWLNNRGFDPYPFILLNLCLSCLAAIQAPVIMMSQNRQEEKDRNRAKKDYMINLKSELEVRTLHEKIDHFIMDQHLELIELQKLQLDMLADILKQNKKKDDN